MNSIMLDVKVDRRDPTDLYAQVAGEIRRAIAEGEAKPGERLPPAKDLAAVLGVNTNTVLRALRVLRDEGLFEFRRGRGVSSPERPSEELSLHALGSSSPSLVCRAIG
jgi:GntR family transcriptional regulator